MSLRPVGLLLALWCVLAIAPALIIAVFMGADAVDLPVAHRRILNS